MNLYHTSASRKTGFTLIETLIAISMLSLAIAAVMSAIQVSVKSSSYAKDEVTGKFLAEEGVEYIRNLRDVNIINGGQSAWMSSPVNIAGSGGVCGNIVAGTTGTSCDVDPITQASPVTCGTGTCPALLYDSSKNVYTHTATANTSTSRFTRSIQVTKVDPASGGSPAYSVKVHSVVSWQEGTVTYTATADDYLYSWYNSSSS